MSVIVRDDGFHSEDWAYRFVPVAALADADASGPVAVDIGPDADLAAILPRLSSAAMIRIAFPSFSDGRGFTLARKLRAAGFAGRLRAQGHVLADQYTMARRCGFDEIEISAELAERQKAEHWAFRADWRAYDYRSRLSA